MEQDALHGFSAKLRSKGHQPPTIESYTRDALGFLEFLQLHRLTPESAEIDTLLAYQEYLTNDLHEKANTVRRAVIGIRQFYRHLLDEKIISYNPFDMVVIPERHEKLPEFDQPLMEELLATVFSRQSSFIDCRNAAIVALLGIEGLKAAEAISLNWQDVYLKANESLIIVKGSKSRTIKIDNTTSQILKTYKGHYQHVLQHPKLANLSTQRLLLAFKGRDGSVLIPQMSRHGLKFVLYELGVQCGIPGLNSELLRHYAVAKLIHSGKSAEDIMTHLGLRRVGNIGKHFVAQRLNSMKSSATIS